jgi:sugar O-acyltransferase (sialic acid O-acetyltransferase NeuD family)
MKRLLIVGAGGFGREVAAWADCAIDADWRLEGFLDPYPNALDGRDDRPPVVGDPATYAPGHDDVFACCMGDPAVRRSAVAKLVAQGATFVALVHPTAFVGPGCEIGVGSILCQQVVLTADVVLGDFVIINVTSTVGHDARIGDYTTLSAHCDVTGRAAIGSDVFMGTHAAVLPFATVGNGATVGASSVVLRRVEAGTTVFGVPARRVPTS